MKSRLHFSPKTDLRVQQEELRMIHGYYGKLRQLVWDSLGGRERRKELNVHPCTWLAHTQEPADTPGIRTQFQACGTYAATLRLLLPYLKRNLDVDKCGGPIHCLREECSQPQYYSDAIEYGFNAARL